MTRQFSLSSNAEHFPIDVAVSLSVDVVFGEEMISIKSFCYNRHLMEWEKTENV